MILRFYQRYKRYNRAVWAPQCFIFSFTNVSGDTTFLCRCVGETVSSHPQNTERGIQMLFRWSFTMVIFMAVRCFQSVDM